MEKDYNFPICVWMETYINLTKLVFSFTASASFSNPSSSIRFPFKLWEEVQPYQFRLLNTYYMRFTAWAVFSALQMLLMPSFFNTFEYLCKPMVNSNLTFPPKERLPAPRWPHSRDFLERLSQGFHAFLRRSGVKIRVVFRLSTHCKSSQQSTFEASTFQNHNSVTLRYSVAPITNVFYF